MLRELADHSEQVTKNRAEARELRNTLVQRRMLLPEVEITERLLTV
jgi:hypothetical protein